VPRPISKIEAYRIPLQRQVKKKPMENRIIRIMNPNATMMLTIEADRRSSSDTNNSAEPQLAVLEDTSEHPADSTNFSASASDQLQT
jgi:hypothetical protein